MPKKLILRVASLLSGLLGLGILAYVTLPILSYEYQAARDFPKLLNPVVEKEGESIGASLEASDFTKASNWFPGSLQNELFTKPEPEEIPLNIPDFYEFSIPSLGIVDATVSLKDEDLAKHLVQYPQTALPGQYGSPVVFGHSTIPSFFNPEKYTTIFSNLPKVKVGSDIFTKFNGEEYTYRISKIYEVKPNELWVLKQNYSDKTIKVITCVPPGTTLRRLVVEGTLINN